jgi:hypothetical protein
MQRRQVLKLLLPLTLLAAGVAGTVFGRKLLRTDCRAPELLTRLQPFSDVELGKKVAATVAVTIAPGSLGPLQALCEQDFEQQYRQLVQADFAGHRTQQVDGWILSQTEALTHLVVSQPAYLSGVQPGGG